MRERTDPKGLGPLGNEAEEGVPKNPGRRGFLGAALVAGALAAGAAGERLGEKIGEEREEERQGPRFNAGAERGQKEAFWSRFSEDLKLLSKVVEEAEEEVKKQGTSQFDLLTVAQKIAVARFVADQL